MVPLALEPAEVIALNVARADLHYVSTSIVALPSAAAAAEIALLQYGAMAAYEAQLHFDKVLGWRLSAAWDAATAKAARMSGKFFADKKRHLDGVVGHFNELLKANHGAFFPTNRRGRIFDSCRDDLAVVTLGGLPYTSLISAHYLAGLSPNQVADFATVGPAILQLSTGIGNIAGLILRNAGIVRHSYAPVPEFKWFDGKSRIALPRLFGGELNPALSAALLTVQSTTSSAAHSPSRTLCPWCEAAARKHRFIALFQSLEALTILRANGAQSRRSTEMMEFLEEPESAWVLKQRKLRNGLVHLGLQDIASSLRPGSTMDDAVRAYTEQDPDTVATRVADRLDRFIDVLTRWMLSPTSDGRLFLSALHPAPPE